MLLLIESEYLQYVACCELITEDVSFVRCDLCAVSCEL